ncbi:PSP1 domain-containing protein [Olivibacter sp. CPCC 100613]|uniref:PSP1 domain-containing protein n=1 Tax=Olivibacter sp. CPCC 100613 TaxID=3079931 RepID=UPI003FA523D3
MTNGCNKLDVYDWLSHMDMPTNYIPFNIVEVRFKGSRKDFYINQDNLYLEMGEPVAVETATGGYDIGFISLTGELVRLQLKKNKVDPASVERKIFRKATGNDMDKYQAAKDLEWETMHRARKLALDLGLSMKLSDVDYQGDKTKATFYYTAEGRVDFRELIKKMAEAFRIRIEMRQIGMRQEASRLGGIGSCGRELCCSTWLTDFKTVSTAAARYQNLSLNTLKLAGQCGKLKCCLNYELDTYMDALKDIPNDIDRLETKRGTARLQKTDIFRRLMWFSFPEDENWIPLEIEQVRVIAEGNKEGIRPDDLVEIKEEVVVAKPITYDYENVVGQDSLTRLDEKGKKKKRPSKKRNKNKQQTADRPMGAEQTSNAGQRQQQKATVSQKKESKLSTENVAGDKEIVKTDSNGQKAKNSRRRYRGKKTNKDGGAANGEKS